MHIHLIAIGHKMPLWVESACDDFLRRLPPQLRLNTVLLPPVKRTKNPDIKRVVEEESSRLLAAVPANSYLVVLDVTGRRVSTEQLAQLFNDWMQMRQDVTLVIGGPDGLAKVLLSKAQLTLSLSDLTFPHTLVRVMIVEQLYRVSSMLNHHPYHRG